jgi:hypothetical protein
MTELDPETGKVLGFITVPERITGTMKYNKKTNSYFLPTFANEIYKLQRKDSSLLEKEKKKEKDKFLRDFLERVRNG